MKRRLVLLMVLLIAAAIFYLGLTRDRGIPILAYHEIGPLGFGDSGMFIDPSEFRRQMEYLHAQGYTTITLRALSDHFTNGTPLPSRPVVLTFDDGYVGVYENAWPILREFGFTGVLFVTGYIGQPFYMTEAQVRTLIASGFELGNHTRTHSSMPTRTDEELRDEIVVYKHELESRFGVEIVSFCYPLGHLDDRVVEAVRQAQFRIGVTTVHGFACATQDWLTLRRIPLFRFDTMRSFRRKLSGL